MNPITRIHVACLDAQTAMTCNSTLRKTRAAGIKEAKAAAKAEADIDLASKECPAEKAGAEKPTLIDKIKKGKKEKQQAHAAEATKKTAKTDSKKSDDSVQVDSTGVANMAMPGAHIKDDPNKLNMGFGVTIDMAKMCGQDQVVPQPIQTTNPVMPQQPIMQPGVGMPSYTPPVPQMQNFVPPMPQQPMTAPGMENMYLQHLEQQAAAKQQPGHGRHKVDKPVEPKVETKKAEADNVNVDLNIKVDTNPPKPPKSWPDTVAAPLPQAEPVAQEEVKPAFDNRALTSKYKYMADIEAIALKCGVQIQLHEQCGLNGMPNGLVSCITYTGQPKPNPYKGFTIDTGVIIDHRAKVFPGICVGGYEDMQAYPILIPKTEKNTKSKSKNVINEKLFVDIFTGGVNMLDPRDGMYTPDFLELNKCIALITMPTNNMNGDIRRAVRDRLKAAMNAGVFANAFKIDPKSRFRFKNYDKKTQAFVLTNEGTPFRFGTPVQSTKVIEITFSAENVTIDTITK